MTEIRIVPDREYRGTGLSEGLARGLIVLGNSENLTGEGMGIGSIAVKGRSATFFSRSSSDSLNPDGSITRTFSVDTKMSWGFRGSVSPRLTGLIEAAIGVYMRHPRLQRFLLAPVMPLRRALSVHPVFEPVPPLAEVACTSRKTKDGLDLHVVVKSIRTPGSTICFLNELSGAHFTVARVNGSTVPPPPGWKLIYGKLPSPSLYDPVRRIHFRIESAESGAPFPLRLFWGREQGGDLSWAGFTFEAGPLGPADAPFELRYRVGISGEEDDEFS